MANSEHEKLEIQSKLFRYTRSYLDGNSNTNRNLGGDALNASQLHVSSDKGHQNSSPLDRSLAGIFTQSSSPRILHARRLRSTVAVDKMQSNWQATAARCHWLGITRWMDVMPPNTIRRTPDPGDRCEPDPGLRRLCRRHLEWLAVM